MESQKSVQKEIYDRTNKLSLDNMNLVNENQDLKTNNHEIEAKYERLYKFNYITSISLIYFLCKWIFSDL
jgi:hypothetical protein